MDKLMKRHAMTWLIDISMMMLAWLVAYWLRFNLGSIPAALLPGMYLTLPLIVLCQFGINYGLRVHRGSWRYCSFNDMRRIIQASAIGFATAVFIWFVISHFFVVPRSVPFIYAMLLILLLGSPRFLYRYLREYMRPQMAGTRVLVIGAGSAGESLVRDLMRHKINGYMPIGFVDDDASKLAQEIHGIKVYGSLAQLPELVKWLEITLVIIAIPSASAKQMQRIVAWCEKSQVPFRIVPSIMDLASGRLQLSTLRHVSLEDLLGRRPVHLDVAHIAACIENRIILVSGGGGSIGSELCRQIARLGPKQLIVVDNNEFNLYSIEMELSSFVDIRCHFKLLDINDQTAIKQVMTTYEPSIVFHAAAYKHVPMLETQLRVAMRNNVLGTQVLAQAAADAHVEKFVLVSSDKAVEPTNIMGATKRIAEIFCQNLNRFCTTQFITVRFGNVLGSAGSVVPLFQKQLAKGGPLTVTHPDITRYFMTIPEASSLILQATALGQGGEIFVLDMGEPIKIQYLAEQIIGLAGLKVGEDIDIVYTGLRPGEKLYEELFHDHENLLATSHNKIFLAKALEMPWEALLAQFSKIQKACQHCDEATLAECLYELVPGYYKHIQASISINSVEQVQAVS